MSPRNNSLGGLSRSTHLPLRDNGNEVYQRHHIFSTTYMDPNGLKFLQMLLLLYKPHLIIKGKCVLEYRD